MDKLLGIDYFTLHISELSKNPDFSPHACRIIYAICNMTTEQLENLNVLKGK